MSQFKVQNLEELGQWVKNTLLKKMMGQDLLLLNGEMGVGKTEIVKQIINQLSGGHDEACSPSFTLHNEYKVKDVIIDHIDLYRLEDESDLESMGFWDLFEKPHGLIIIEWANRVDASFFPSDWNQITVQVSKVLGETESRLLEFN